MDTPVSVGLVPGIHILGVSCGRGARDTRCVHGPQAVRRLAVAERPGWARWNVRWQSLAPLLPPDASHLEAVAETCSELAARTEALARAGERFAVLGGDHSCAVGTWSGVARALRKHGPVGLLWIDAHMDGHVPETGPSGALHGMPLACLLGHGPPLLTHLAGREPAIRPGRLALLGVRSFEPEEARLLARFRTGIQADSLRRSQGPATDHYT